MNYLKNYTNKLLCKLHPIYHLISVTSLKNWKRIVISLNVKPLQKSIRNGVQLRSVDEDTILYFLLKTHVLWPITIEYINKLLSGMAL